MRRSILVSICAVVAIATFANANNRGEMRVIDDSVEQNSPTFKSVQKSKIDMLEEVARDLEDTQQELKTMGLKSQQLLQYQTDLSKSIKRLKLYVENYKKSSNRCAIMRGDYEKIGYLGPRATAYDKRRAKKNLNDCYEKARMDLQRHGRILKIGNDILNVMSRIQTDLNVLRISSKSIKNRIETLKSSLDFLKEGAS